MNILTKRLRLRKLLPEDYPGVKDMCSDIEVMRFIGPRRPMNDREIMDWFNKQIDSFKMENNRYAVALLETNEFIGMIGIQHDDPRDFGYYFRRKYWGHGYAIEACEAALNAIDTQDLYIFIRDDNFKSVNLIRKLGFIQNEKVVKNDEVGHYYIKSSIT